MPLSRKRPAKASSRKMRRLREKHQAFVMAQKFEGAVNALHARSHNLMCTTCGRRVKPTQGVYRCVGCGRETSPAVIEGMRLERIGLVRPTDGQLIIPGGVEG